MKTYDELLACAEADIGEFCVSAINEFRGSEDYKNAVAGQAYYDKHNLTIEKYRKFLYTVSGGKREDIFSANYKLKTTFFRRLVSQQVQYVLGNGVVLDEVNKLKLGRDFDYRLQLAAKKAMAQGRAFGFWNLDHLEVFGYADTANDAGFCPLYDTKTSALMAGIRFWYAKVGTDNVLHFTLYTQDGYTDFLKTHDGIEIIGFPRAYKITVTKTAELGTVSEIGENYGSLPIVQLFASDTHESELVGIRECIDAYDFIKSGFVNDIDDTSGVFWVLKNSGGMEDEDLAKFVQRIKTVKATVVEGDDISADAHTIDIPVTARQTALELLRRDIYEDFQSLDVQTLSASAKTAQEIKAAYQSQDNKCADFEYCIRDFLAGIFELAGITEEPNFVWNRITNQTEQTTMILQAANYLSTECIIEHLPFLTPEEAAAEIEKAKADQLSMFNAPPSDEDEEEEEEELNEE